MQSHSKKNQKNYNEFADIHNQFKLQSGLFLVYRDLPTILETHLFNKNKKKTYRLLDFGCGVGLSTEIISNIILSAGHQVNITGIDINKENLKFARSRLPKAKFVEIDPTQELTELGEFDLIICNFVLLENKTKEMITILQKIQTILADDGVFITTNCGRNTYKRFNEWFSSNHDFKENDPVPGATKLKEDQPVKMQVFTDSGNFTFFDFFHSGKAYRNAYQQTGFTLLQTHKPLGKQSDDIAWKSELKHSPFKIHVLGKQIKNQPELSLKSKL